LFVEALARRRATGDQLGTAHVLNNFGWLEFYAGDLARARLLVEEALEIRLALRSQREAGVSTTLLGKIVLAAGEPVAAATLLRESLEIHVKAGNRWGIALALEGVASLVAATNPHEALRLAAAGDALRVLIGRPPPAERPFLASWLAPARQRCRLTAPRGQRRRAARCRRGRRSPEAWSCPRRA
jgi:hypothetical protein